jgi:hypothetical protein
MAILAGRARQDRRRLSRICYAVGDRTLILSPFEQTGRVLTLVAPKTFLYD